MPRSNQPRLDEVAALSGLSRATVSRVINDAPNVSAQARAAVDRAVATLGYVPNLAARSLVTRRTDSVALVVTEPEARVFSDPFFATAVRAISATLTARDLQLVLLIAQHGHELDKAVRYVRQGHVDGVILLSLHGSDPLPEVLRSVGMPTVLFGRPSGEHRTAYVDADNRGGARAATEFLLGRGRGTIATITGPMDMVAGIDRFAGYTDALRSARIPVRKSLVATGGFTEEGGAAAMTTLLRRRPDLDAVFIASDPMAFGALGALQAAGRRVPQDVSVVGFDDVSFAAHSSPPLTTIHQPLEDMARSMCELLMRHINGAGGPDDCVIAPTTLVERGSA